MERMTIEQWEGLSPDEQEERVEEMPAELAEPDTQGKSGVEGETDEKGVPLKNRIAEANRKLEEAQAKNAELQEKLISLQQQVNQGTPAAQKKAAEELRESLAGMGYETAVIDKTLAAVEEMSAERVKSLEAEIQNLRGEIGSIAQKSMLEKAEKEDKFGVIARHKDEIQQALETLPSNVRGTPEAVEWAVNKVKAAHFGEGIKSGKKGEEDATTMPPSGTTSQASSANTEEEKEALRYANQSGVELKEARRIVSKRKKALANLET